MKKLLLILFALFSYNIDALSCLNEYRVVTKLSGIVTDERNYEGSLAYLKDGFDKDFLESRKKELQGYIKEGKADFKDYSDLAVIELKIGDRNLAIKILDSLVNFYPSEYSILSNLGTAYELQGENRTALDLLQKAYAINPKSHRGSEWIHIAILKEKLKETPDYSRIINLKEFADLKTFYEYWSNNNKQGLDTIHSALRFQLKERISFIKAPDQCIGQLCFDLAEITAVSESLDDAKEVYELAKSYDDGLSRRVDRRLEEINSIVFYSKVKYYFPEFFLLILAGVLISYAFKLIKKSGEFSFLNLCILHIGVVLLIFPMWGISVIWETVFYNTFDFRPIAVGIGLFLGWSISYITLFKKSKLILFVSLQLVQSLIYNTIFINASIDSEFKSTLFICVNFSLLVAVITVLMAFREFGKKTQWQSPNKSLFNHFKKMQSIDCFL
ncbi:hypothetical protein MYP_4202 [Sporocytophaga myxococcoides]|uniref:Uncharacterized protein n=1 Tax=Sporocytophaga myxococcoides TaxID=153721 RepID=A0A098LKT6_9BACT|nr:tetratricopeptide repeat protein [Sporocytophaga myxococcoides]GAL86972.1 hypothetical protein MYP_4202 [Sporocytophaga myxococcoides]